MERKETKWKQNEAKVAEALREELRQAKHMDRQIASLKESLREAEEIRDIIRVNGKRKKISEATIEELREAVYWKDIAEEMRKALDGAEVRGGEIAVFGENERA